MAPIYFGDQLISSVYHGADSKGRGYFGDTLVFEKGGGPPDPVSGLIINGSGDSGTDNWFASWTNTAAPGTLNLVPTLTSALSGHAFPGTYAFTLSSASTMCEWYNGPYDIPSDMHAAADGGNLQLDVEVNRAGNGSGDNGNLRIEFWSGAGGTGVYLGYKCLGAQTNSPTTGHDNITWQVKIARGARSFRYMAYGSQNTSDTLNYFFQIRDATLSVIAGGRESVFPDLLADHTGWTNTVGSAPPPAENPTDSRRWWAMFGGSQSRMTIYRDVAVASLGVQAQAAVTGGTASLMLQRVAWNTNASDCSRSFVECLSSSNTILATVQDAAVPTKWNGFRLSTNGWNQAQEVVAVPATTDKFRIWKDYQRQDGTVNDARIALFDVAVEW